MSKKGFDYEAYKRWYYKQEQVNLRAGKPMYINMYTYQEAKFIYEVTKEDLRKEFRKGKRGSVPNVYQYMAREQQSELSYKRAKAVYKYVKATGQDFSFNEIRYMSARELKEKIDWSYSEIAKETYIALGHSLSESIHLISTNFFGSE